MPAEDEEREAMFGELDAYMDAQIDDHIAHPRDDLTSFLIEAEIGGSKLSREHVRGTMILLMIAGIDTTWSAIGAALWHLARHPGDRRRLASDPGLMGTAVEEFLRAYAPVTMARLVAKDFDFHGHPLKEGDWLLLPFPAANRDPSVFENPDAVQLDREKNRHAAFGLGRHRCLGSSLARMELRVALEEWMARYPDFELIRSRGRHLVRRPGPRPAHAPRHHPLTLRPCPVSRPAHDRRSIAAWARAAWRRAVTTHDSCPGLLRWSPHQVPCRLVPLRVITVAEVSLRRCPRRRCARRAS